MKILKTSLIIAVVIGLLVAVKFLLFPSETSANSKATSGKGVMPASPVTIYLAGISKLGDKLEATGTVLANEEADLKPEVSGRITYLHLPEGQYVVQGTLLLKINDADLKAQLDKIKSQLKLASESEARQRRMLQMEGTSQQEYDQALATLTGLRADSAYYQAQIAKTEIRAPFSGTIGIRNVSPGSYVTPASVVATIQQTNPVKIDFSLPEKYASLLQIGSTVQFRTEASNTTYQAKIVVRDPKIDATSRNVRYRAVAQNPNGKLLSGSYARIDLSLTDKAGSIYVPTEAVVPTLKGKKVFVVKNNVAEERVVQSGLRTSDKIQIYEGLSVGDSVVVTGNMQLKPGATVKVLK
jgi:membrane fusion protein, multidrug efflux system